MQNPVIANFFSARKEAWLKEKTSPTMGEEDIKELKAKCQETFSPEIWLPISAKKAWQMSISTHPCTFSHPSAKNNRNGNVTAIIANVERAEDGFLKTGNVEAEIDALGSAGALGVYKFLTLVLEDGLSLLEHIQQDTELAKDILNIQTATYEELKTGFLAITDKIDGNEVITSPKISQVYFPVDDDYHLLSLLTNSGVLFQLKERINKMKFSDEAKASRDNKRHNNFSEYGYSDIFNLTIMGIGGTNPQNISVLNSNNAGKAYLLPSIPPLMDERDTKFPKLQFFGETLKTQDIQLPLRALQKIIINNQNNAEIRDFRDNCILDIFDVIVKKMWAVRSVSIEQFYQPTSVLPSHQLTWLHNDFSHEREISNEWLNTLISEIVLWVDKSYKEVIGKEAVKLETEEIKYITLIIEQNKEALR